jgi:ABC-type Fe3+/spermidine/putrescine transport system ATPase subunit
MVRPENVRLVTALPEAAPPDLAVVEGSVRELADLGPTVRVRVSCAKAMELVVMLSRNEHRSKGLDVGERVWLAVAAKDVHVMEE